MASRNTTLSASTRMNPKELALRCGGAGMSARTRREARHPGHRGDRLAGAGRRGEAASPARNGMISRSTATTLTAHPRNLVRSAVDSDRARP